MGEDHIEKLEKRLGFGIKVRQAKRPLDGGWDYFLDLKVNGVFGFTEEDLHSIRGPSEFSKLFETRLSGAVSELAEHLEDVASALREKVEV